jgi:hypothetical protein
LTAINIVVQPKHKVVHIASDGATYTIDGIAHGFGTKVLPVPHWPGAVAGRGTSIAVPLLGTQLSYKFSDFDSLIAGVESALPAIVDEFVYDINAELFLVGWSAKREAPESYVILTMDDLPMHCTEEQAEVARSGGLMPGGPFQLLKLPKITQGPPPQEVMSVRAFYSGIDVNSHPNVVVKSLRKMLEMQRHDLRADGIHWVGGFGQLTTITPTEITQRILQTWPDKPGERIKDLEIDWLEWCRKNGMPPTPEDIALTERCFELYKILGEAA